MACKVRRRWPAGLIRATVGRIRAGFADGKWENGKWKRTEASATGHSPGRTAESAGPLNLRHHAFAAESASARLIAIWVWHAQMA